MAGQLLCAAPWSLASVYFGECLLTLPPPAPLAPPPPQEVEEAFDSAGLISSGTIVPEECEGW